MNAPTIKLAEATHVSGILTNSPDERGTLIVQANTTAGAIALPLNLN